MTKSKKLWNVAGFSKSFTDAKGTYHAVDHNGEVKAPTKDVPRLLADGFTDTKPVVVKDAEEAEKRAKEARLEVAKAELALAEEALNPPKTEAEMEGG